MEVDMKLKLAIWLLAAGLFIPLHALADCPYAGKSYPTGTRVGNLTCQADGTWR